MDIVTCYNDLWACLQNESSREALMTVGGFLVVVIGGVWIFFTYFADKSKKPDSITTSNSQVITTGQNSTPQQNQIQSNHAPVHVYQNIGYTIEQHQQALREREAQIRADLSRAHEAEKQLLERELNATQDALTDIEKDYQEKIEQLQNQIDALDKIKAIVPHDAFSNAQNALLNGETKLADDLYASLQNKATEVAAEAAYQRGVIAEDEIRWQEALRHFIKANELLADNEKYLIKLAELYELNGQYLPATDICKKLYEISQTKYGSDSAEFASINNNLGAIYRSMGKYDEAKPLYKKAITIAEKALGLEHPGLATSYNNLAALYKSQGKYDKAEPLYKKAIAIYEKALGLEHPELATSYNNLAGLYMTQGKFDQAEPLYKMAIVIDEKALGLKHPKLADKYNNLATLYKSSGKYDEAEFLYQKAIAIGEKALGLEHPDIANRYNNLAGLYMTHGKYDQAEPLYKKAIAIYEKALGLEHPELATSYNNLAGLYSRQDKFDQAESFHKKAIAIDEKALGFKHPSLARDYNNLAGLYSTMGKHEQAEPLFKKAIDVIEKSQGLNHPKAKMVAKNYLECLEAQGKPTNELRQKFGMG